MERKLMVLDRGQSERLLADFAHELCHADIAETVRHEAKRSILNIIGTTFSGCHELAVDKVLHAMNPYSGNPVCSIIGRREKCDAQLAAFVNAMAANIFDYDDNHPATIIHPTAPLFPALLAYSESHAISGQDLIRAFIIGGEVECRIGNAISPHHYSRGWHITSTCGVFASAFGVGSLLKLSPEQFVFATGNAAVQSAGLVEGLGYMAKSLSVGNAARLGMMSALLASTDFDGPLAPLSGERGFLHVYCDNPNFSALTEGLGEDWEISKNTYKPYPAGVVLNPVIDASLEIASRRGFETKIVKSVTLKGHSLLRQRTDRPDVATGREAQVSAQHAVSIAFRRGQVGLAEFSDAAVQETLAAGRPRITFVDDDSYDIDSVDMTVDLEGQSPIHVRIDAARGGAKNPLSDEDIENKVRELSERVGFTGNVDGLIEAVWMLDTLEDAGTIARLAAAGDP
jgi:2-methylcitrate dehydratase PrpD